MKRYISILLIIVLASSIVLTGCGADDSKLTGTFPWCMDLNDKKPDKPNTDGPAKPTPEPTKAPDKPITYDREGSALDINIALDYEYGDDFDMFLDGVFLKLIENSSFDMHYKLEYPEELGLSLDYTIGQENLEDLSNEFYEYVKSGLDHFDISDLNDRQRIKYKLLAYEYDMMEKGEGFDNYICAALSQNSNVLNGIQSNFSEYPIVEEKDAEDYIEMLMHLPGYLEVIMDEISKQVVEEDAKLTKAMLKEAKNYAKDWLPEDVKDNALYVAFATNIKEANLSEATVNEYCDKVAKIIEDEINPVIRTYQELLDTFESEVDDELGLYHDGGADYYNYLLEQYIGAGMDAGELLEYVEREYEEMQGRMVDIATNNSSAYYSYVLGTAKSKYGNDPYEVMESLKEHAQETFPYLGEINWIISYLNDNQKVDSVTAYYLSPQLDNTGRKVIRINNDNISNDIDLYATMAHEGIPGHLYQDEYRFSSSQFDEVDACLTYLGVQEGWAMYIEKLAHTWCLDDEALAELVTLDTMSGYVLCSMIDIRANYLGQSKEEIAKVFKDKYGVDLTSMIDSIYSIFISDPGLYPAYGIGYLLINDTVDALLDSGVSEADAYESILKIGNAPFTILWEELGISNPTGY